MKEIDSIREALIDGRNHGGKRFAYKCHKALAALSTIEADVNAKKVGPYFCAQMPCSPSDCIEVPCRYIKDAISNRNNCDPDAKPQEPSEDVIKMIWAIREDSPVFNGEYIEHRWRWSEEDIARVSFKAHDDAIRQECADRAVAWYRSGQASHHQSVGKALRAFILGPIQSQDDDGCEVHIFRGPRTEEERMANIDRKAKADIYAMHICETCSSESGAECTRRNCQLNNAWESKPARDES